MLLGPALSGPTELTASGRKGIVVKFLLTFPQPAASTVPLSQPQALAIDPEGHIYVVDSGNHRIVKFDASGNVVRTVGGFGWEREQFDRPLDITAKTGLDLFVADFNNERIERYDLNLNFISSFYSDHSIPASLQFGFPGGVDISRHGEIFIVDNENNRILKLNVEGSPDLSFGDFNWGAGQLQQPAKIEVSASDQVFVSDQKSNQIVVFDYYGNFVNRFGDDVLRHPRGLTVSPDGNLYVADTGHHRVAVFSSDSQFIFSWGDYGDKIGAFNHPLDVGVHKNRIYVLDSGNSRVQVFELAENSTNSRNRDGEEEGH
ncbi:MAG TPA: NHL repeat-containing protein [bacterium]